MKYVHVVIPLNITTFFTQAEILQASFLNLTQQITPDQRRVSFTKAITDAGLHGERRNFLPFQSKLETWATICCPVQQDNTDKTKKNQHIQQKRNIKCIFSYSYEQKQCGQPIEIPVMMASILVTLSTHPTRNTTQKQQTKITTGY